MDFEQIVAAIDANHEGPHTPESVLGAASAMTHAGQYLNRATEHGGQLGAVHTVHEVLAALRASARDLDPLLKHLTLATDEHADSPQVHDRRGGQHVGADTAAALLTELGKVRDAAADLAQALDYACSYSGHLDQHE